MLSKLSNEVKVGVLVFCSALIVLLCAWIIGVKNPFERTVDFYLTYNFAGGIEVGSPVRVAGIKVGKVEQISFFKESDRTLKNEDSAEVLTPLKIKISVSKDAVESVRADSKFYINLAGIIGERYIEITPGTYGAKQVASNDVLRGVDPPRIDQLISQSFNLAGKIQQVIEDNEGDITKSIKVLYELTSNINKTVAQIESSKMFKSNVGELINNLISITRDVKQLTAKTQTEEGKKTLELLHKLLWRLEPLDQEAIQKFFQKEGIRARLF